MSLTSIHERNTQSSTFSLTPDISPKDRASLLVQKVLTCSAIKDLFNKAENWEICFCDRTLANLEFGAICDMNARQIRLAMDLTDDEAISTLTFELINAMNSEKFITIHKQALNKEISCEDYVKANEKIEYEGTKLHHQIMLKAIKELGWNKNVDPYGRYSAQDFEISWNQHIKFNAHSEYYRKCWSKLTKQDFAALGLHDMIESSKWLICQLPTEELLKTIALGGLIGNTGPLGFISEKYGRGVIGGIIGSLSAKTLKPFTTSLFRGDLLLGSVGPIASLATTVFAGYMTHGTPGIILNGMTYAISYLCSAQFEIDFQLTS